MSTSVNQEIEHLLDESERSGSCLATVDDRLRKALARRVRKPDRDAPASNMKGKARRPHATPELVSPVRSLYIRESTWNKLSLDERALHVLRGLQTLHPDWVFCHDSAAVAWGLPLPGKRVLTAHVASKQVSRSSTKGDIVFHKLGVDYPVVVANGVRVTPFVETLYSVLAISDFVDGLPLADRALRMCQQPVDRQVPASYYPTPNDPEASSVPEGGRVSAPSERTIPNIALTPQQLKGKLRSYGSHRPGSRRVIGIMGYANARSESWAESVVRALMIANGFDTPRLQVEFDNPLEQGKKFRVDMVATRQDGTEVIIEVDGMLKYEDARMLNGKTAGRILADEQHREAALSIYRLPILRLSYRDFSNVKTFIKKLEAYGISRDENAMEMVRRLGKIAPGVASHFSHVRLSDEALEQMLTNSSWLTGTSGVESTSGIAGTN